MKTRMATTNSFLQRVRRKMEREGSSQTEVADACDLSQGHLSRVLRGALPLTGNTRSRLTTWLDRSSHGVEVAEQAVGIVRRLVENDSERAARVLAVLVAMEEAMR